MCFAFSSLEHVRSMCAKRKATQLHILTGWCHVKLLSQCESWRHWFDGQGVLASVTFRAVKLDDVTEPSCDDLWRVPRQRQRFRSDVSENYALWWVFRGCNTQYYYYYYCLFFVFNFWKLELMYYSENCDYGMCPIAIIPDIIIKIMKTHICNM